MGKVKGSGRFTKDLHVRLSEEEHKKLTIIAEINGVYRGKLLRKVIQNYLKNIPLELKEEVEHRTHKDI